MTPDADELCVFAVKRGYIENRVDPHFYLPVFRDVVDRIKASNFVQLGDIAQFSKEMTDFTEFDGGEFNYLEISGVSLGTNSYKTTLTKISDTPSRAKMKTRQGDIVISTTRPHRGAIAEIKEDKVIASTGFSIIRNIDSRIEKKWFLYTLLSNCSLLQMLQRSSGGNYPAIIEEEIKSLYIPLISKATQIESVLKIEKALEVRNERFQQLEELLAGLSAITHEILGLSEISTEKINMFSVNLKSAFSSRMDPEFHNPFYTHRIAEIKKLKHDTLGNIIDFSTESWNQKSFFETFFPYIEISGVKLKENTYETTDVPIKEAPSRAKMIVRNGDIIVSTTRPHRGAITTIVCPDNQIQIASTGFCVLRNLKRNDVLKEYLQWILLDDYVLLQMLQRSSGGNYPAISADELKKVLIPIPDVNIQKRIYQEAEKRKLKAYALRQKAEQEWQSAKTQFEKELLGS